MKDVQPEVVPTEEIVVLVHVVNIDIDLEMDVKHNNPIWRINLKLLLSIRLAGICQVCGRSGVTQLGQVYELLRNE